MTRAVGPEDNRTLEIESYLTRTLNHEGRYSEAEKLARQTYTAQLRILGPQDPATVNTLQQLGEALAHTDRYSEAAQLLRDAIAKTADSSAQGNPFQLWYAYACVAAVANRSNESIQYLQEAVNRGYKNADGLMSDIDLKNLRGNPEFMQLVAALKSTKPEN
jgi:tetratricopeptide (TPR) repeat protein